MVTINLIAWRLQAQQYYREQLKRIIGATLLLSALSYSVVIWQLTSIENALTKHKLFLEDEIHWRDPKQSNGNNAVGVSAGLTLNEMNLISNINKTVLFGLQAINQSGICFKEVKRTANTLMLSGEVTSASELLEFVRHWRDIHLFSEVKVAQLKQMSTNVVSFQLAASAGNVAEK